MSGDFKVVCRYIVLTVFILTRFQVYKKLFESVGVVYRRDRRPGSSI